MGDAAFMEGVRAHEKALPFHDTADPFLVKAVSHHKIAVTELVRPMAPNRKQMLLVDTLRRQVTGKKEDGIT